MSIPTLVIGLGGTGILTVRYLKSLWHRLDENERVPTIFRAVDFDLSATQVSDHSEVELEELGNDEFLFLSAEEIEERAQNLHQIHEDGESAWDHIREWYPQDAELTADKIEANGASQFRPLGRLGFFAYAEILKSYLFRALQQLPSESNSLSERPGERPRKRVIVISSTGGGTGAGMLVDTAYLLRGHDCKPKVLLYLLLPEVYSSVDAGNRLNPNTYAMLKELAHLKNQIIPFKARYQEIEPLEVREGAAAPFSRLYLFGPVDVTGNPILPTVQQMAHTILAQLHPLIQEKNRAVVSNTAIASTNRERRRLEKHVFSTAGSRYINLSDVQVDQNSLLHEVLETIRDDQSLQNLYGEFDVEPLEGMLRQVGAPPPPAAADDEPKETRERQLIQLLVKQWEDSNTETLDHCARELTAEIEKNIHELRNSLQQTTEKTDQLFRLLAQPIQEKHYQRDLQVLQSRHSYTQLGPLLAERARELIPKTPPNASVNRILSNREALNGLRRHFELFQPPELEPRSPKILQENQIWQEGQKEVDSVILPALSRAKKRHTQIQDWASSRQYQLLDHALHDRSTQAYFKDLLRRHLVASLEQELDEELARLKYLLEEYRRPWQNLLQESPAVRQSLPEGLENELRNGMRKQLPDLLEIARQKYQKEKDFDAQPLLERIKNQITQGGSFKNLKFHITTEGEGYKERILKSLSLCRQALFERRTPNPQRKGHAVLLVPDGIDWPGGTKDLYAFLENQTQQILQCRAQVMQYEGSKIWIYYEDLFNPPEHLKNLGKYYLAYEKEKYKETFHIDRRMLVDPRFREINLGVDEEIIVCGNPGCSRDIGSHPRDNRICPYCFRMIRSRCGNFDCSEDKLHSHERAHAKNCPTCGGYNYGAWWKCDQHGKTLAENSIEKSRCLACLTEHRKDPLGFPISRISQRPDLEHSVPCPFCEQLKKENPAHEIFIVREDLLPYYRNGVNGHESATFAHLSNKYELPEGFRCPRCSTVLIPVHHSEFSGASR